MTDQISQSETRASLLLRIRDAEDNIAWKDFVAMYYPMIYRWASRKGLQPALAEEIAQQVLYRVAQSIGKFQYEHDRGRFRGWLFTVTRREVVRLLQSENRAGERVGEGVRDAILESLSANGQDAEWDEQFSQHICNAALSKIQGEFDSQTWTAFEMVWKQELTASEVGERLQRPTAWVYKAKFRVMKRFKQEVLYLAEDNTFMP